MPTITIEDTTMAISTSTSRTATPQQRLLFTHKPWIYHNLNDSKLFRTTTKSKSVIKSITQPSKLSSTLKTPVPIATPWYSPAGPYDWWQWQWYTTKSRKASRKMLSTNTTVVTTTGIRLTNRTSTIPTSTKSQTTANLFKWADQTTVSTIIKKTTTTDEFDAEYKDWLESFTSEKIQEIITSTTSTLGTFTPRDHYQQIGYSPTISNSKIITINTPPAKRQHSQQSPVVSERNALATATNGKKIYLIKQFY